MLSGGDAMKFFRIFLPVMSMILYLGVHNGNLALYRQGHKVPVQVYAVPVTLLPKEDQAALTAGIPIENEKQLSELLEAYLS